MRIDENKLWQIRKRMPTGRFWQMIMKKNLVDCHEQRVQINSP